MAILPILVAPHPVLKTKAKPVDAVDDEIRLLMDDMLETMYNARGIGLAAPQVGVSKRVLVMDVAREEEDPQPICMANPEIIWASEEEELREEGCLSLPEQYADVVRPLAVRVRTARYKPRFSRKGISSPSLRGNTVSLGCNSASKCCFSHLRWLPYKSAGRTRKIL